MILPGTRMDADDFEEALAAAMDGQIITGIGADEQTSEALDLVARAAAGGSVPAHLVQHARDTFAQSQS